MCESECKVARSFACVIRVCVCAWCVVRVCVCVCACVRACVRGACACVYLSVCVPVYVLHILYI